MKKIMFLFAFFLLAFIYMDAQSYALVISPSVNVGAINRGTFEVSSQFDKILKSIDGVNGNIDYNIDYNVENNGNMKVLDVRLTKSDKTYLIGFEIGTSDDISALRAGCQTITHSCEGSCSSGTAGVLTYCSFCDFVYENEAIIGCKCKSLLGCCVHTITATDCSSVGKSELSNYINTNILQN